MAKASASRTNSSDGPVGAKVTERVLSNGITARTSPLSPYANAQLSRIAEEKFPDVDKKPFMHEHPDSVLPLLDESAWTAAQTGQLIARNNYWSELVIGTCVDIVGDHTAYIEAYARQIERLRKHVELPEDPWDAVLLYVLLENREDVNHLLQDAQGITPLSAPEVADGLRIFRPEVHQPAPENDPS